MRKLVSVAIAALVALTALTTGLAACGDLKDASPSDAPDGASDPNGGGDGGARGGDSARPSDGAAGQGDSAAPSDAGVDGAPTDAAAGDSGDSGRGPTGLDPAVVLPNLGEPTCDQPGNPSVCGGTQACRMATPDSGRCDDCNAPGTCGTLITHPCSASLDCDVDLQCFRGQCTLVCTLPTGPECGGKPNSCIDVGYLGKGLCDPTKLF